MTAAEQKAAAKEFADFWKGKGYEKGQTQPFWLSLLRDVLGVEHPERIIEFEDKAHIDSAHGFIDGYIPSTHVLIEQKSLGKNLRAGIPQSDGSILKPYQQALRYSQQLPYSQRPRWIVTCNFAEFDIYDMERPNAEPERLLLEDLPNEYYRLSFLVDTANENIRREEEISKAAGDVVGELYAALLAEYRDPTNPDSLKSLNELCVRLVFCLYGEDSNVFLHLQFHDYLKRFPARDARRALIDLFRVLDTPKAQRDPYLDADLANFPHVNGALFRNQIEIPQLSDTILELLLKKGSEDFDWKDISPTIFGAIFESTLNPETRRKGGMHYTSVANIHKVIDPLFLDRFKAQLADIKREPEKKKRDAALRAFIDRLASLTFLDPACGSGNFLTETYTCLRRLENEALALLLGGQSIIDFDGSLVKVSIHQFHGIEVNDFAVSVAKAALWIAENQMLRETETLLRRNLDFLPLKDYAGIVEGDALRIDWATLAPHFDYIVGNPPFIGASLMSAEQKEEAVAVFGEGRLVNSIDFVGAWFHKAAALMRGTDTRAALVATNSITQGEQVEPLWAPLFAKYGIHIDFAYRTFRWDSESNSKAHVHVVIVGFSCAPNPDPKLLFEGERHAIVPNINAYLYAAPDIFVASCAKPISEIPHMTLGNKPADDGNLILSQSEMAAIAKDTPDLVPFLLRYVGARDFIRADEIRFCLWLRDASPLVYHGNREVMRRLAAVKEFRESSTSAATRKEAATPWRFFFAPHNGRPYLLVPRHSSEGRRYVPIGFMPGNIIASDAVQIVPDATVYHFGVLTSNVHMAWMRAVAGRLKSDYRYSGGMVYNTFPWPEPTGEQKARIEQTAQGILDARAAHPDLPFSILYDELTMPPDLRKAHQDNDRAVMSSYGFKVGTTESECVAELFKRYQALIAKKDSQQDKRK